MPLGWAVVHDWGLLTTLTPGPSPAHREGGIRQSIVLSAGYGGAEVGG
jgi:hypothetical protein